MSIAANEIIINSLSTVMNALRLNVAVNNPFTEGPLPSILYKRADNKLLMTVTKLPEGDPAEMASDIFSSTIRGMTIVNAADADKFEYAKDVMHPVLRELAWTETVTKAFPKPVCFLSAVLCQPFADADGDSYNYSFVTEHGYFISITEIDQFDSVTEKEALDLITGEVLMKHPAVVELLNS